jgi:superfamily I DNA and/or RNA helicase
MSNILSSIWWKKATINDLQFEISAGTDFNVVDHNGHTPLHYAAEHSTPVNIQLLIEIIFCDLSKPSYEGIIASFEGIDGSEFGELTPLHLAAGYAPSENVKVLVDAGADLQMMPNWELTPLHFAACHGNTENINLLLDYGADLMEQSLNGNTPLHYAARDGTAAAITELLKAGADPRALNYSGETSMDLAQDNEKLNGHKLYRDLKNEWDQVGALIKLGEQDKNELSRCGTKSDNNFSGKYDRASEMKMSNVTNNEDYSEQLASPEVIELISNQLQELRKRLLDSSRRNPLVNIQLRANSTNVFRIVDELPDILRFNLTSGISMRLIPLPALEEELPDELTDDFLDTLHFFREQDTEYLDAIKALDPAAKSFDQEALTCERELKDRVREHLTLPQRQTKESPSLEAHALAHGISPDYSLPMPDEEHKDGRHQDTDIQTLMLPEKLSRISKSLLEKGRGFERETGVNVLHLAFGLLDWKSPGEDSKYVSPLALLEIRIERKQSRKGAEFHISGEGSLFVNTTLKQKLFSEHRLDLPDYSSGSIESYFEQITDAAPSGWHWKVRREIAVGIFPSSKIAMYHDLDPQKQPIATNQIVGRLLATTGSGESAYAEVYNTDTPETARKVPFLIMDADASQFSALVDVADGKNISIEGPPGSGKSQTIVNIIASALADKKRVLFVAEKLTALDVVKNRLDAAGLGEFILPLQAGKGTRDRVYKSLESRLAAATHYQWKKQDYEAKRSALEERRSSLQNYLDILSSDFGSSGLTVFDVIGHGISTKDARDGIPKHLRRVIVPNCEQLGTTQIDEIISDTEGFSQRLGRINNMPKLWIEANAAIVNRDDAEDVCENLQSLINLFDHFTQATSQSIASPLFVDGPFETNIEPLSELLHVIVDTKEPLDLPLIESLLDSTQRRLAKDFISQVQERRALIAHLGQQLNDPEAWGLAERLRSARTFAASVNNQILPSTHAKEIERIRSEITIAERQVNLALLLPGRWADNSKTTLLTIYSQAKSILKCQNYALNIRRADPDRLIADHAKTLIRVKTQLDMDLEKIQILLPLAGSHKPKDIRTAANTITGSGLFRFLSSDFKTARNTYTNILGGSPNSDRVNMSGNLNTYAEWLSKKESFEGDTRFKSAFGPLFLGLRTDHNVVSAVVDLYNFCSEIAQDDNELRNSLETTDLQSIRNYCAEESWPDLSLSALENQVSLLKKALETESLREEEAKAHLDMFKETKAIVFDELEELLAQKVRSDELKRLIDVSEVANLIGERFQGTATQTDTLNTECRAAEKIIGGADPALIVSILRIKKTSEILLELNTLKDIRSEIEENLADLRRVLELNDEIASASALSNRIDDLRLAVANPSALMDRARLRTSEETFRKHGFSQLVDWVLAEGNRFTPTKLGPIVRSIIAKSMADRAYQIHGDTLQGYDGEDFDLIRTQTSKMDRDLIAMARNVIRDQMIQTAQPPKGNGIGKKSTYTDMSLIRNEMGKKRNRIGVRELTARAGSALLELKPCWMMSPLAVAQYLHSGLTFDLVVIDEASQMTTENAIGALSRGQQAVVVGDTKQLPPTNFFQRLFDDSDTEEDFREDSESVLDKANMAFRPIRQLRWHYRSRHSALIQFSNTWMYDEKLTIFPSAREDDPEFGVHLEEVSGIYKGRTNFIEAQKVVSAVVAHMSQYPNLSLGVCTMNSDQKELIREEFERELERNNHVDKYVADWQERNDALEEFFIKNLETIQGDERDVMFISTLYGPEMAGAGVHQRFGPINSKTGHRRLNVLFTRAKRKIVTFTSLKPADILVSEDKNRGVRMFRAWLEYCKTGRVPDRGPQGGEAENPFEWYVAAQIEAMGCEAIPQVGAAGYRIDIGVKHPDWPYGFLLGVECDGASYHSSKSSRERDRLRQEVLEGLGWRFHRIWSTDWFNDPQTQIENLKKAIDKALEIAKTKSSTVQNTQAHAVPIDHTFVENKINNGDTNSEIITTTSTQLILGNIETEEDEIIKLGSKVKIEHLSEKNRKLSVTLVDKESDLENGKISINTPLGQALLYAQEGDTVEYQLGVQVKEVLILKVE